MPDYGTDFLADGKPQANPIGLRARQAQTPTPGLQVAPSAFPKNVATGAYKALTAVPTLPSQRPPAAPAPVPPAPIAAAHTEQSAEGLRSIPPQPPMNAGIGAPDMTPRSATSAPVGVPPAAPAPAQQLPPWALQGIQGQGANPGDFQMMGDQLVSSKTVDQNSPAEHDRSVAANPQIHGVGVQAPAQTAGRPGLSVYRGMEQARYQTGVPQGAGPSPSGDPARDSMMEMLNYYRTQPGEVGAMQGGQLSAINALADYDRSQAQAGHFNAEARALNPNAQIDMLRQITDDPNLRATYLAGKGVEPGQIGQLPSPIRPGERPVNQGNYQQFLGRQENAGAAGILSNEGTSLYDKLNQYQSLPGAGDPNSPNHAALQAFVNKQYANPREWEEETYLPPNPDESGIPGPLRGILGTGAAITHAITGSGHSAGTGPGWAKLYQDRSAQQSLLQRLGILPPGQPQ